MDGQLPLLDLSTNKKEMSRTIKLSIIILITVMAAKNLAPSSNNLLVEAEILTS
jgi:hypothetical protein